MEPNYHLTYGSLKVSADISNQNFVFYWMLGPLHNPEVLLIF